MNLRVRDLFLQHHRASRGDGFYQRLFKTQAFADFMDRQAFDIRAPRRSEPLRTALAASFAQMPAG